MLRAYSVALAVAFLSGGCAVVGDITGAVAGLASGAATANPAVGISVGIAVRAGTNEALDIISRRRQRNEQDAIAAVAANLAPGERRPWAVDQRLAGDARGEVEVVRVIENSLATCKELAFSVVKAEGSESRAAWFTTIACQQGAAWKWAAAEPAVARWISLQ